MTTVTKSYVEARDVAQALAAMADGARPVAGGTDLVVGARHGKSPLPQSIVGIHRIPGLRGVRHEGATITLGALVTHAEILADSVLAQHLPGLLDASAIVGSHATRAQGTIGGNVMNASPAMDTGAPLLCHDAVVVLAGPGGERRVGLADLWLGPGRTSAAPGELMVAVEVPTPPAGSGSAYVRLQYRRQMEIAVVGAAAYVELSADGASIASARVAITALAPVIHRVAPAEAALVGAASSGPGLDAAAHAAGEAAAAAARPISDVRASAGYRSAMAAVMARRAVLAAVRRARGESLSVPASDLPASTWSDR